MDHLDAVLDGTSRQYYSTTRPYAGDRSAPAPESVATFTHEIRTPLATINATLELLTDEPTDDMVRQLVARLQRGVNWITNLVENLNTWSDLRGGEMTLNMAEIEVRDWIEQAMALVQPLLEQRGQTLLLACPQPSPRITGDAFRLSQVMLNLLTNASRYGAREDTIAVTVIGGEERVEILVSDHGPGIPEHEREAIFAPGKRGSRAQETACDGQGLGLCIVAGIVEGHGGSVGVDSELGRGSTFWIHLPVSGSSGRG